MKPSHLTFPHPTWLSPAQMMSALNNKVLKWDWNHPVHTESNMRRLSAGQISYLLHLEPF